MSKVTDLNDRIIYFDFIRIISHFALVLRHMVFIDINDSYGGWLVSNFYRSITPWIIPLLLMLSGAIFLDTNRNITTKSLYLKNIKRLLVYFFVWSLIYTFLRYDFKEEFTIDNLIKFYLNGYFHLWYIPYAIAMYMLTPLLRKVSDNKSKCIYICVILTFYCFLYYPIRNCFIEFPVFLEGGNFGFISFYLLMFFIGNLLNKYELSKKWRIFFYISGILSTFMIYFGTHFLTIFSGEINEILQSCDSPFSMIQGIALFIFIKEKCKSVVINDIKYNVLSFFSKASFGVYMIHPLIIDFFGNPCSDIPSVYFAPLICIGISIFCYFLSYFLKRIPIVGKYLV